MTHEKCRRRVKDGLRPQWIARRASANNGVERSGNAVALALDRIPVIPRRLYPTLCRGWLTLEIRRPGIVELPLELHQRIRATLATPRVHVPIAHIK